MKWINRTLISTVIVLLIVAVLVLVAVLGFYTTGGKMEVGSWADWVSALSTLGTLGIAFAAYTKAPDWFKQKIEEDGYKAAYALINHDIHDIYQYILKSKSLLSLTTPFLGNTGINLSEYFDFNRDKNVLVEIRNARANIERNFLICNRHGYKLVDSKSELYDKLIISMNELILKNDIMWQMLDPKNPFPIPENKKNEFLLKSFDLLSYEFEKFDFLYKNLLPSNEKISDIIKFK